jgi:hypothetical protein
MSVASSFANMSRVFCQQMGWWELAVLMDKYVPRLFHGVKEELVPLVELASLKQPHARALFQAGTYSPPPPSLLPSSFSFFCFNSETRPQGTSRRAPSRKRKRRTW